MSAQLSLTRRGNPQQLPLVLLHAFPLDARMWDDVVAELDDLDVLTVDGPGFGTSPHTRELSETLGRPLAPSLETYADAVALTLNEAGVNRAVVAGLSMGGYAALALAERHRGLLAGLGLLDTRAGADDPVARAARTHMAEQAVGAMGSRAVGPMLPQLLGDTSQAERPDVVDRVRAWLDEAPPAGIAWAQRAMGTRPDRSSVLEDLEIPVLVLRGAEDRLSSQDDANAMAAALRDVEVVVVPRAGHLSAVEAPQEVASALRALHARCR